MISRARLLTWIALPFGLFPLLPRQPQILAQFPPGRINPIVTTVAALVPPALGQVNLLEVQPIANRHPNQRHAGNSRRESRQLAARWQESRRKEAKNQWLGAHPRVG